MEDVGIKISYLDLFLLKIADFLLTIFAALD